MKMVDKTTRASGRCLVCGDGLAMPLQTCPDCVTPHHRHCWNYNGGCAVYGCASRPYVAAAGPCGPTPGPVPHLPIHSPAPLLMVLALMMMIHVSATPARRTVPVIPGYQLTYAASSDDNDVGESLTTLLSDNRFWEADGVTPVPALSRSLAGASGATLRHGLQVLLAWGLPPLARARAVSLLQTRPATITVLRIEGE
jgi:hypothetical protein